MLALLNPIGRLSGLRGHKAKAPESNSADLEPREKALIAKFVNLFRTRIGNHGTKKPTASNSDDAYDNLRYPRSETSLLRQLAVVKIDMLADNPSLEGTNSACHLGLKDGMTFMDATVDHVATLNSTAKVDTPLIILGSRGVSFPNGRRKKEDTQAVRILTLKPPQTCVNDAAETTTLCSQTTDSSPTDKLTTCMEAYKTLQESGVLKQLIKEGKRYLFVSSYDNLGATIEARLIHQLIRSRAAILEEVVSASQTTHLRNQGWDWGESLPVNSDRQSVGPVDGVLNKQKPHNTGSFWINIHAMKQYMDKLDSVRPVSGPSTSTIVVPPARALAVRSAIDLLLLRSDIYHLAHGALVLDEQRSFTHLPTIRLDSCFNKIEEFNTRFRWVPKMIELDDLTVSGNVYFGKDVTLKGTVIVAAKDGHRLDIPDGTVLKDCLLSGYLSSTEI